MASHPGVPARNTTLTPLSRLLASGNIYHLFSLFHKAAANLGLLAPSFPPIIPVNISTLSIGEQMLLLLRCTSLQSSVHIATTLENLSPEILDLSAPIPNLDLSLQPPNFAPIQASLRDIASSLLAAAQAPFPSQALTLHHRIHTTLAGHTPPQPATPTLLVKRKGRKELLRLQHHHLLTRGGPPP